VLPRPGAAAEATLSLQYRIGRTASRKRLSAQGGRTVLGVRRCGREGGDEQGGEVVVVEPCPGRLRPRAGERVLRTSATAISLCARPGLHAAHHRLLALTRPATGSLVGSTVGDLTKTKAALVVENALLRHQPVVLQRQVGRPVLTPADRLRLVLLARLTREWRSALQCWCSGCSAASSSSGSR
jgi:hypothetical protein